MKSAALNKRRFSFPDTEDQASVEPSEVVLNPPST